MFGFGGSKKKYEEDMAAWLALPEALGIAPVSVKHKRTSRARLAGHDGTMEVHLLSHVMPDGSSGRSFLNPPFNWTFREPTDGIRDDDLVLAYCGWLWLSSRLASGAVQTVFETDGEEAAYLEQKQEEGFTDLEVTARFKIGESEVLEMRGRFERQPVRLAGSTLAETAISAEDPCHQLPAVYFLLGAQVVKLLH